VECSATTSGQLLLIVNCNSAYSVCISQIQLVILAGATFTHRHAPVASAIKCISHRNHNPFANTSLIPTLALHQPRFKENSTFQIPKFEVTITRSLAWTRFSRSLGKTYLQEVIFLNLDFQLFLHNAGMQIPHKNKQNQRK
jgi:hypothetical protein